MGRSILRSSVWSSRIPGEPNLNISWQTYGPERFNASTLQRFNACAMDLTTAFVLGLVGSLHCAGMCGPLALALPGSLMARFRFLLSRAAYNLGRITTYCLLGMVFGALGQSLVLAGLQRWVSIVSGIALLAGLFTSSRLSLASPVMKLANSLKARMAVLLRQRSVASFALLGLCNGLLPCGLVYVACAGATSTGHMQTGLAYMAAFGAGTVPMMLGISLAGRVVPAAPRLRLQKVVPAAVFLLAVLLIVRGLALGIPYLSPDLAGGASCCHP